VPVSMINSPASLVVTVNRSMLRGEGPAAYSPWMLNFEPWQGTLETL